jgi:hypothetical protein
MSLPHAGTPKIVYDYVGQTVRTADIREAEHLDDKPWADLIAGRIQVIDSGMWTKTERDERELRAIHLIKPRFNYDGNLANPQRIEIWRQAELRHARDRAAGRALWIPAAQRAATARREAALDAVQGGLDGREPRYPVDWAWDGIKALARFLGGLPAPVRRAALLSFAAVAGGAAVMGLLAGYGWPQTYAAAAGAVVVVSGWAAIPRKRRRRRRRRR